MGRRPRVLAALQPKFTAERAWCGRMLSLAALGRFEEAKACLEPQGGVRLGDAAGVWFSFARQLGPRGLHAAALRCCEEAERVDAEPDDWSGWFARGEWLQARGHWRPAVDAYRKSIDLNPGEAGTWGTLEEARRRIAECEALAGRSRSQSRPPRP